MAFAWRRNSKPKHPEQCAQKPLLAALNVQRVSVAPTGNLQDQRNFLLTFPLGHFQKLPSSLYNLHGGSNRNRKFMEKIEHSRNNRQSTGNYRVRRNSQPRRWRERSIKNIGKRVASQMVSKRVVLVALDVFSWDLYFTQALPLKAAPGLQK